MIFDDTICAISTPQGIGGIAVIRISGNEALAIADKVWHGASLSNAPSHTAHFGEITDPDSGDVLDQAVATIFVAPKSFTGENVVEFSVHGSRWVQHELLRLLVRQGCRLAGPGEFTRRAFADSRLDLAEAEAVADVIASASRTAHRLAVSQLRGDFSQRISQLRDRLIDLAAKIELELDFSEEDVEFVSRDSLLKLAGEVLSFVDKLAASFAAGQAIRNGVPVAIVGATNAGKSSLLNRLVGDNRAIVSDIHGTTRDTIEESIDIDGVTFRLIDTAGIRSTDDPIESLGIERSLQSVASAKVIVWVVDSADPSSFTAELQTQIADQMPPDSQLIVAANKTDLGPSLLPAVDSASVCPISALTGQGIEELRQAIRRASGIDDTLVNSEVVVTNERHYEALTNASYALRRVIDGFGNGLPLDLIAQDLREAIHHLGAITGAITSDTLLHTIFSRFCIGK